jgi:hypothetical protein
VSAGLPPISMSFIKSCYGDPKSVYSGQGGYTCWPFISLQTESQSAVALAYWQARATEGTRCSLVHRVPTYSAPCANANENFLAVAPADASGDSGLAEDVARVQGAAGVGVLVHLHIQWNLAHPATESAVRVCTLAVSEHFSILNTCEIEILAHQIQETEPHLKVPLPRASRLSSLCVNLSSRIHASWKDGQQASRLMGRRCVRRVGAVLGLLRAVVCARVGLSTWCGDVGARDGDRCMLTGWRAGGRGPANQPAGQQTPAGQQASMARQLLGNPSKLRSNL